MGGTSSAGDANATPIDQRARTLGRALRDKLAAGAAPDREEVAIYADPVLYVLFNGRQLVGVQPLVAFERIIESELAREGNKR